MNREIRIFENEDKLDNFAIQRWIEMTSRAVGQKGLFTVALSGGRSPLSLYHKLSQLKDILPWDSMRLFMADERFVPFDNEENNFRLLRENLLNPLNIASKHAYPVPVEEGSAEGASQKYARTLKEFFKLKKDELPRFDLIMLGVGEDGHIASLFPGADIEGGRGSIAIPAVAKGVKHKRISLSLPVINNARSVIFVVKGQRKSDVMKKVLEEADNKLPAVHVKPVKGKVYFLLDASAASRINHKIRK